MDETDIHHEGSEGYEGERMLELVLGKNRTSLDFIVLVLLLSATVLVLDRASPKSGRNEHPDTFLVDIDKFDPTSRFGIEGGIEYKYRPKRSEYE